MNYNIHFSCISHIGRCRSINQDNFICDGQYMGIKNNNIKFPITGCVPAQSSTIFGIFDGIGGQECGEIASFIAAKKASRIMIGKDAIADISQYCLDANEEICSYAKNKSISAMGTTAAMLVFTNKEIVLCNIGDSKIFCFSEGMLEQISHDHVAISSYGMKPPLLQNLGIPQTELLIEPYIAHGRYRKGDIYLLCSDGLTDMLKYDELTDILSNITFHEIAFELLMKALANGGRDNISVIVCKIECSAKWLSGKI